MPSLHRPPTVNEFKTWATENRPLARMVVSARVFCEMETARVAKYAEPLFAKYTFLDEENGEKIMKIDDLYLTGDVADDLCAEFYAKLNVEHRAHGFTGRLDCCPALIAEGLVRDVERALLESLGAFYGIGDRLTMSWDKAIKMAMDGCLCELV